VRRCFNLDAGLSPRARDASAERALAAWYVFPTFSLRERTCSGRCGAPSDGGEVRPLVALWGAI